VFLTRFRINTARPHARKLLSSPHRMHAAVMASFADPAAHRNAQARTLWRVDELPDIPAQRILYMVSPAKPDLTHLVEQAGWPTTETWQTRSYSEFLDSLRNGQQWAFRLTGNPVRYGRRSNHGPTQRFGHVTVDQQRQWLLDRTETAGFRVVDTEAGAPDLLVHSRRTHSFARGSRQVTLRVATYDGRLEVTDADRLRHALCNGIGHAKAYGCGLLTLAPVRQT
jgi:CRISPR system Cascade subunit CasE